MAAEKRKRKLKRKRKREVEVTFELGATFEVERDDLDDIELDMDAAAFQGKKGQAGTRNQS